MEQILNHDDPKLPADWREHLEQVVKSQDLRTLLEDGLEAFWKSVEDRILAEHPGLHIHKCSQCGEILMTPKAKQCLDCGYDWH